MPDETGTPYDSHSDGSIAAGNRPLEPVPTPPSIPPELEPDTTEVIDPDDDRDDRPTDGDVDPTVPTTSADEVPLDADD